jgi:hypothetical protein
MRQQEDPSIVVPDDERVEDAGLNYEDAATPVLLAKTVRRKRAMTTA